MLTIALSRNEQRVTDEWFGTAFIPGQMPFFLPLPDASTGEEVATGASDGETAATENQQEEEEETSESTA